jgi:CheY-like chemotaxis protein
VPELVLLDIRMPILDGYQTAKLIKSLPTAAPIPIYAISGWVGDPHQMSVHERLFAGFLTKPVSAASVERLLKRREAGST